MGYQYTFLKNEGQEVKLVFCGGRYEWEGIREGRMSIHMVDAFFIHI
jgi:hypothetical protein